MVKTDNYELGRRQKGRAHPKQNKYEKEELSPPFIHVI